jgi:hypothetical protein
MNRAASLRMLDERAAYESDSEPHRVSIEERGIDGFKHSPVPTRSRARVAAVYAHPHEMPNHDYFWGSWLSLVVEEDHWVVSKPELIPKAEAIGEIPQLLETPIQQSGK